MSPVSRGRKTKKNKKGKNTRGRPTPSRFAAGFDGTPADLLSLTGMGRQRPDWFGMSIGNVLDGADVVLAARGPRELEQATAELLGAEMHRAVHEEQQGLWFDRWLENLAEAAATRVRETVAKREDGWQAPWRLLRGMTSIAPTALRPALQNELDGVKSAAMKQEPGWLKQLPRIIATGEVWTMRDVYGSRLALIAEFSYPDETDPSVFLFDIDVCGPATLASAGVFDDVAQAAVAWRTEIGETADAVPPKPVETSDQLRSLTHCDTGVGCLQGDETRNVMENWFRSRRRTQDLAAALRERGMPLPSAVSLYRDLDTREWDGKFTDWYLRRNGVKPDPDGVLALAEEWMEGTLPDAWHSVSPHRIEYQLALINDWIPEHPTTIAAKALFPEWVRWHAEEAELSQHFIDRALAVANGAPRQASDCASQHG
jgi:hypothetical protein